MKKYLLVLFLIVFIVPSVALASWWNPFSWFNDWTFKKVPSEVQLPFVDDNIMPTSSNTDSEFKKEIPKSRDSKVETFNPAQLPKPTTSYQIPSISPLVITTASKLPNAKVGKSYSATINVSGGNGSYSRTGEASFPIGGLGFTSSYGNPMYITGTPSKIYVDNIEQTVPYTTTFNVIVTSGSQTNSKQFTLTVDPATTTTSTPFMITTPSKLPNAKVGQLYSVKLNTSGVDSSEGYSWSGDNRFPMIGFSLVQSYGNSNYITGTPSKIYVDNVEQTVPYTFTFTITVNSGPHITASKEFKLTVDPS